MPKTGTRPPTNVETALRMTNPDWLHKRGLSHEPVFGWSAPGKAVNTVHRQLRVLQGGYQGRRRHHRKLVVAWERVTGCVQCGAPIRSTARAGVYEGKRGLIHAFHNPTQAMLTRPDRKFNSLRRNQIILQTRR
jgi:hypothetical protein